MEPTIISQILLEKCIIQKLSARGGPIKLVTCHERMTKLVWTLLQTDPSHVNYIKTWETLVDYGEKELRYLVQFYQVSTSKKYTKYLYRLTKKISLAVSILY
ncbi:hypothetical protein CWM47_09065 [Spirosoma pollinicola]|uniref:Uncharacterized protein n=1 Tax=Spirosoma pollinicola TaxID=2057025 RepID=A0A2K8YWJ1_9BACT|nr:hypothetical protein CWM47_09065 [Spirosoma pollinicola]